MAGTGIFPINGVAPSHAVNTFTPTVVPECVLKWYDKDCPQKVDGDALNAIQSEILRVIDCFGIAYDCTRTDHLARALCAVAQLPFCRSQIVPTLSAAWPPTSLFHSVLIDDTVLPLVIWLWDCNDGLYRQFAPPVPANCNPWQIVPTASGSLPPEFGISGYYISDVFDARGKSLVWQIDDNSAYNWYWSSNAGASWTIMGSYDAPTASNPYFKISMDVSPTGVAYPRTTNGGSPVVQVVHANTATWRLARQFGSPGAHDGGLMLKC